MVLDWQRGRGHLCFWSFARAIKSHVWVFLKVHCILKDLGTCASWLPFTSNALISVWMGLVFHSLLWNRRKVPLFFFSSLTSIWLEIQARHRWRSDPCKQLFCDWGHQQLYFLIYFGVRYLPSTTALERPMNVKKQKKNLYGWHQSPPC